MVGVRSGLQSQCELSAGGHATGRIYRLGPFKHDTDYFDPSDKSYMFNIIVDDLEGALAQVKEGGATIVGEIEKYDYGSFGWFLDPEGNKVELWVPPEEG